METITASSAAKSRRSYVSSGIAAGLLALFGLAALFYLGKPSVAANEHERFEFGSEIEHPFGDKVVKGSPFSAQVIIEDTQTLANGTHISHKLTGALYRDSEGRTRQEFPREGAAEMVRINDSVSGTIYTLNVFQHTIEKINVVETGYAREAEDGKRHREMEEREKVEKMQARNERHHVEPQRKVESLGVQAFEGIQADVTRFSLTVPAGMEGNDQPFEIVSEKWYSSDLNVLVMAKRSDPRSGELNYRLTNISRAEPARALFEPPADFTVQKEKREFVTRERK